MLAGILTILSFSITLDINDKIGTEYRLAFSIPLIFFSKIDTELGSFKKNTLNNPAHPQPSPSELHNSTLIVIGPIAPNFH